MSDLNVIVITGRCTKNAELSYTSQGTCICHFTIANNESRKDPTGKWIDTPSFFECTLFGKYAESMSRFLTKGRLISVTGRLKQDRWEKDGQKQSRIQIIVSELSLLPTTQKKDNPTELEPAETSTQTEQPQEEIPFDIV